MPSIVVIMLLGLAAVLSAALAISVWQRRTTERKLALTFVALMVAVVIWILIYLFEILVSDLMLKMMAHNAKFLGIVILPVAWFVFAAQYTGIEVWSSRRRLLLLNVIPVITTLIIWTNPLHNLMWQHYVLAQVDNLRIYQTVTGTYFWLHSVYSYVLILAGDYLLFRQLLHSPGVYRRQLVALLVAVTVPIIANINTILAPVVPAGIDLTPLAFTVTGLALTWGLLRYHLLDLTPMVRNAVIDSMTDGMIVLDSQERIVDVNPPAQKIMGRTAAEIIGQPAAQAIRVLAQQPELIEQYHATGLLQTEILIPTTDPPRYLDVRVSPLRDRQQRSTGHLIVFRDITERKQAEQQIQEQNEILTKTNEELALARKQAELAAELKSQFLANVSHELRTPLSAIIGYTELQVTGMVGSMTEEQLNYQRRVLANAEQLLGLINSILDLSKIEAGYMELRPKQFKLRTLLNELEGQHRILAEKKGLQFVVELDDHLSEILTGDMVRLKQIMTNLLSNAIKFTDQGYVSLCCGSYDKDHWKITVGDSGIGIPAYAQESIFEEFRQLDGTFSRQYGGTGLGLAIVRKLVNLMNGTIQLQSEVGQGSTFTIILPYAQPDPVPEPA